MDEFKVVSDWRDDLIWCPSQCYLDVEYEGKNYQIYLRWRWDDPWTADLVPVDEQFSEKSFFQNDWIELEIPFFTDEQLDECKAASILAAKKILSGEE